MTFAEENTTVTTSLTNDGNKNTKETTDTPTINVSSVLLDTITNKDVESGDSFTKALENVTDILRPTAESVIPGNVKNATESDILSTTEYTQTAKISNSDSAENITPINSYNLTRTDQSLVPSGTSITESNIEILSNYSTQSLVSNFVTEASNNVMVANGTEHASEGPGSPDNPENTTTNSWISSSLHEVSTLSNQSPYSDRSDLLTSANDINKETTTIGSDASVGSEAEGEIENFKYLI